MTFETSSMMMMNPSSSSSSCSYKKHVGNGTSSLSYRRRGLLNIGGFCDVGQLDYYRGGSGRVRCGGEKKGVKVEEKKKKRKEGKLVKELYKGLEEFYGMGFGLEEKEVDHDGVVDEVKLKMMKEAAELLLEQLKVVRGEEKELKKKMKKEEKKMMKAEKKLMMVESGMESSSSSSESESSDSESDNEMVVDLKRLKDGVRLPQQQQESLVCTLAELPLVVPMLGEDPTATAAVLEETYRREADVVSGIMVNNRVGAELGGMVGKKIEVCMGGKCKKSGAATLMEEFQRVAGFNPDVVVSGCKCMGKCKEGPNVRVVNNSQSSEDVPVPIAATTPKSPLCLGVGVEDVHLIVSNFFGDESHQNGVMGVPAAAV